MVAGTSVYEVSFSQHCVSRLACRCENSQLGGVFPIFGSSKQTGLRTSKFVRFASKGGVRKSWAGVGLVAEGKNQGGEIEKSVRSSVRAGSDDDRNATATAERPATSDDPTDALLQGMTFAELCNDFECNSSPQVRGTARQLAKDLLEIREGSRSMGILARDVQYKDPLRSFKGRSKYRRLSYIRGALTDPKVAVQEMKMLSTSRLVIKWSFRGKPKTPPASLLPGDVIVGVTSTFELNQISGQVLKQTDEWDLSGCPPQALAYFFASRLAFSTAEAGKDTGSAVSKLLKKVQPEDDSSQIYADPSDPRRFFQQDDNERRDLYQGALFVALIYLGVQFLKTFVI